MDTPANLDNGATLDAPGDVTPLVIVYRPANALQAEIVRGTLEAEGIFAIVGEQVTGAYAGPFSVGEGQWGEIMVSPEDADRAMALLADYDAGQSSGVSDAELNAQAEAASDPQV